MSDYFRNARDFSIGDHSHFTSVHGNQYNNSTIVGTVTEARRRWHIRGNEEEEAEYEQYREFIRGDIRIIRELHHARRIYDRKRHQIVECEQKVFIGEIASGEERGSKFTIVSYKGRDALEEWRKDFRWYAEALCGNLVHLFALNRSKIPLLIFTGELIPAVHFQNGMGILGRFYFQSLRRQLSCENNQMWIDPTRGILCRGPDGPWSISLSLGSHFDRRDLPPDSELLQEDVCMRFLTNLKSAEVDRSLMVPFSSAADEEDTNFETNQPSVISSPTDLVIAVGTGFWEDRSYCLGEGEVMKNGETRFTLKADGELCLTLDSTEERCAWLSQASSVFHACGVSLEDNLSRFKLVVSVLELSGTLSGFQELPDPMYLFIRPLPLDVVVPDNCMTNTLHYWSFEPDGESPLSADMCHQLGLPAELLLEVISSMAYSWPSKTYKLMHQYQVARGFDPTTTNFARYLGYPIYQNTQTHDSVRFEEIQEEGTVEPPNSQCFQTVTSTDAPERASAVEQAATLPASVITIVVDTTGIKTATFDWFAFISGVSSALLVVILWWTLCNLVSVSLGELIMG